MFRDFLFLRKIIASTATTAVNALYFSHCPILTIISVIPLSHTTASLAILAIIIIPATMANHYTWSNSSLRTGAVRKLRHSEIP